MLGLVIAVVIAVVFVGRANPIRYGLDLQGGLEVVLRATPNKGKQLTKEDLDKSVAIIRDRVDKLGVSEPEIRLQGKDQIAIELPGIENPDQAVSVVGSTAQLNFFETQETVVGKAYRNAYLLLDANRSKTERELAKLEKKKKSYESQYFLFGPEKQREARNPIAGPATSIEQLLQQADASGVLNDSAAAKAKKAHAKEKAAAKAKDGHIQVARSSDSKSKKSDAKKKKKKEWKPAPVKPSKLPGAEKLKSLPHGYEVLATLPDHVMIHGSRDRVPAEVEEVGRSDKDKAKALYVLFKNKPCMSGAEIRNATAETQQGGWITSMNFTGKGGDQFGDCTEKIAKAGSLVGQDLTFSIVLDDEIKSSPSIDYKQYGSGIRGGSALINGLDDQEEAESLALVLNTGSLPVRFEIISKTKVSATLGAAELKRSLKAGAAGLVAVVIYLILFYRFLGVIAGIALGAYAWIFYGIIVGLPVTMTLPGIAGIVLTIGVAADANIIIFERIREEYASGRTVRVAIISGYKKGLSTIADASVVTLITALILFMFGISSVRGFALLLGLGTLLSILTAVILTYALLGISSRLPFVTHPQAIGANRKGRRFRFSFMRRRRLLYGFSISLAAISLLLIIFMHINLGVDFKSGTKIAVSFKSDASVAEVRDALSSVNPAYAKAKIQRISEDKTAESGANSAYAIQLEKLKGGSSAGSTGNKDAAAGLDAERQLEKALDSKFTIVGDSFSVQTIGPTFGKQVIDTALIAIIISLILEASYIGMRFDRKYVLPVIVSRLHVALVAGGAYALTGREFSSATVAALLTILGYSLYDAIIVFDRIRENVRIQRKSSFARIVDTSLNEVLMRSINTVIVVLLPVGSLYFFGGETLRDFAFALMVGVFFGAMSSLILAAPMVCSLKEREPAWERRITPEDGARILSGVPVTNGSGEATSLDDEAPSASNGDHSEDEDQPSTPPVQHRRRDKRSRAQRKK